MRFLFKSKDTGVFITAEDPTVHYDTLCGHCGYPVAATDGQCPRCQRSLEDCPVCTRLRKRKSLRSTPTSRGEKKCSVCGVRRLPFGVEAVRQLQGSFCTNLYGCPAGGMLLRTEELALLPVGATFCPICRHESLRPRDVLTFPHVLRRCLFCSACLGQLPAWPLDVPAGRIDLLEMRDLYPPVDENREPCILCGRSDRLVTADEQAAQVVTGSEEVIEPQYLRMVQLGRALVLDKDDAGAFSLTFNNWFDITQPAGLDEPVSVEHLVGLLIGGTQREDIHIILKRRFVGYCAGWDREVQEGVGYRFGARSTTHRMSRGSAGAPA